MIFNSISLFLVTAIFGSRIGEPLFLPMLEKQVLWNMIPEIIRKVLIKVGYEYAVPFLGIVAVCLGVKYIKLEWMKQILAEFGNYTLKIYVLHGFFVKIIHTEFVLLNVIVNTVLALILSLTIAYTLEKSRILAYILFGRNKKEKL